MHNAHGTRTHTQGTQHLYNIKHKLYPARVEHTTRRAQSTQHVATTTYTDSAHSTYDSDQTKHTAHSTKNMQSTAANTNGTLCTQHSTHRAQNTQHTTHAAHNAQGTRHTQHRVHTSHGVTSHTHTCNIDTHANHVPTHAILAHHAPPPDNRWTWAQAQQHHQLISCARMKTHTLGS